MYDSSKESSEDNSEEELDTHIENTNWRTCSDWSKMETATESLCCLKMLEISDEILHAIYSCLKMLEISDEILHAIYSYVY